MHRSSNCQPNNQELVPELVPLIRFLDPNKVRLYLSKTDWASESAMLREFSVGFGAAVEVSHRFATDMGLLFGQPTLA